MEKFILSHMERKNFSKAVNELYLVTDYNNQQYQNYWKWYYEKNIPRILDKSGEVIFYLDGFNIIALSILKKTPEEQKLCTLMTTKEYRKRGFCKLLLEDSFDFLKTDKPLVTIPKNRIDEFSSIINAYNWKETQNTNEYITEEIIFNSKNDVL